MTVIVDDAGSGDLLFGVVVGAYREETGDFKYDLIDVRFYQENFKEKEYLQESSRVVSRLVAGFNLAPEEEIHICQGCIFDVAAEELRKVYGEDRVKRIRVEGEAQRLIEIAYLDEIRNLGYEPLAEREEKRGKSFYHMMRWLKDNPEMLRYAKTGWPKLKNYQLFKKYHVSQTQTEQVQTFKAVCADCGNECEVPFQPKTDKPVYCKKCWTQHKPHKNGNHRKKRKPVKQKSQ
ncbi:MAG: CxxC-x17-CxxC domain-containing protein [Candidatus Bathyarchaeia archaeon]